ncbi:MAG TPA: hypothetical protein VIW92_04675 [Thermoanaerobaculia bacterium]
MSTKLSIAEIMAKLEARIEFHRRQASHHVAQEAWHREQSAHHSAELEKVLARFEAFKATATEAADLAVESVDPQPKAPVDDLPPGKQFTKSKLIQRVIQDLEEGTPFNATYVAAEVNRRFRERMKRPVDRRVVGTVLRRLRDVGELREVVAGRSFHEAKYSR